MVRINRDRMADAACATCGDSCGIYACTDCRGVRYCSSECQMDVLKMLERECARDSVEIQARERAREAKREAKHEKKRAAYRAEVQATKQARADAAEEWFKQCEAKHERQRAAYRAEVQAREQARADAAAGEKWVKKLMAEVAAENREKVQRAEDERILERARVDRERLAREKKEHALAAAAVAAAAAVVAAAALPCPRPEAAAFKESLGLHPGFFDSEYDRCYCPHCYPPDFPDTIVEDGPTEYVVPRGWVRFGLKTPPQAAVHEIFDKWSVSFHGVKSVAVLKGVLDIGGLLKPGDRLPDGSLLRSTKCNGEQASGFFTSPTIRCTSPRNPAAPHLQGCMDRLEGGEACEQSCILLKAFRCHLYSHLHSHGFPSCRRRTQILRRTAAVARRYNASIDGAAVPPAARLGSEKACRDDGVYGDMAAAPRHSLPARQSRGDRVGKRCQPTRHPVRAAGPGLANWGRPRCRGLQGAAAGRLSRRRCRDASTETGRR